MEIMHRDELPGSFEKLFGFGKKEGDSSVFAGTAIEVMKEPYLGKNGHIAIQTNYIDRAIYHLEQQGYTFREESKKYGKDGKLTSIYFTEELGGFAVHLVQK